MRAVRCLAPSLARRALAGATCLSLLLASPGAQAVSTTAEVTAASALLGLQLAARHSAARGKLAPAQLACFLALQPEAYFETSEQIVGAALSPADIAAADDFFNTPAGRKYARHGLLGLYTALGLKTPEPLPEFSAEDIRAIEAFQATPVGQALVQRQVLASLTTDALSAVRSESAAEVTEAKDDLRAGAADEACESLEGEVSEAEATGVAVGRVLMKREDRRLLGNAPSPSLSLVANPDLPKTWAAGHDLPAKPCTYCNKCLLQVVEKIENESTQIEVEDAPAMPFELPGMGGGNVGMINLSDKEYVFEKGDKVAQVLIQRVEHVTFEIVDELSETERGDTGFGSSGK